MKNLKTETLAMSLGREINRQIAEIEAKIGSVEATDDDPFAGIAPKRSKLDSSRRLKNLQGARTSLGGAYKRFQLVKQEIEKQLMRAELELCEAITETCTITGHDPASLAESVASDE